MNKTIAAVTLFLCSALAVADSRIAAIELAWNKADTGAVQDGFSDKSVYYQARLAEHSEHGGVLTVINSGRVANKTVAALVQIEDRREVWLFAECKHGRDWCYWDYRPTTLAGSAEIGQAFDLTTTAVSVAGMGFVEANPMGLVIVPIKVGLTAGSHYMAYDDCMAWRTGLDIFGYGAGVANIATMLGAAPVGAASALVAVAWYRYGLAMDDARFECAEYALS